jgi:hypothetical protein
LPLKYYIEKCDNRIIDYHIKKIIQIDQTIIHINELTKCPICHELDINIQTNCTHSYCLDCISKWYNKSSECPLCKQEITHIYYVLNKQ